MADFIYGQQSFIIGRHNELHLEKTPEDKILVLERNIPIFYAHYYPKLKRGSISSQQIEELSSVMHSTFNQKTHFYEIASCTRDVQVQAFNLFTQYAYYEIKRGFSLTNEDYDYINNVMQFGEESLGFVHSTIHSSIDFGTKGLVKSELCKYHNHIHFGYHTK